MVLENIHGSFSPTLTIIVKNIFSEPQPDSANIGDDDDQG